MSAHCSQRRSRRLKLCSRARSARRRSGSGRGREPRSVWRRALTGSPPRCRTRRRYWSWPRSAIGLSARRRGRPIAPRTAGTPSASSRSWVTSSRLPARSRIPARTSSPRRRVPRSCLRRRASARDETAGCRPNQHSPAAGSTHSSLLDWTTTSSRGAGPGTIAIRNCASWPGIARAIACASSRQRRCSSSRRSGARTRRRRAYAPDATGPAKWRFRWRPEQARG
jgi:hypothetical protein